jgi:hypothetical protein
MMAESPPDVKDAPPVPEDGSRLSIGEHARRHALLIAHGAPYWLGWLMRKSPAWLWYLLRDLFIGIARVSVFSFRWLHMSEERESARKMENNDARHRAKVNINKDARFRQIVTLIVAVAVLVAHLAVLYGWPLLDEAGNRTSAYGRYAPWLLVELVALLGLLEWIGHQPRPDDETALKRRGALTHGTSTRTLRRDLEEGFAAKKMPDVGVIGLTVNKYGWHGIFETEQKIDDALIEHLERWVHAPAGSLHVATDPRNAAAHHFKLLLDDPLANPTVPDEPTERLDIRKPQRIGRHLFGTPLEVNLRTHIGLIGRTRSGKSSGLWVLIDRITLCANARVYGIDLSNGPALPIWRKAIYRRATEYPQAAEILDTLIKEAERRNAKLTEMAEDDSDEAASDLDENWDPTPSEPALYVAIDEFHILADDKELLDRVKRLVRVGGKANVFVVLATPKAGKEDLGSIVIRAMIGLKILFSCEVSDVVQFLGGGMADLGWMPHRLKPAAGGQANDAGKAFVMDGDHQEPEVVRISRLSATEVRSRARRRSGVDLDKGRQAPVTRLIPTELVVARDAFEEYGAQALPTAWILRFATTRGHEWSATDLATRLRSHGVPTGRYIPRDERWKGTPKGYFLEDIQEAIERRNQESA